MSPACLFHSHLHSISFGSGHFYTSFYCRFIFIIRRVSFKGCAVCFLGLRVRDNGLECYTYILQVAVKEIKISLRMNCLKLWDKYQSQTMKLIYLLWYLEAFLHTTRALLRYLVVAYVNNGEIEELRCRLLLLVSTFSYSTNLLLDGNFFLMDCCSS